MKNEPEIIRELKEEESSGKLHQVLLKLKPSEKQREENKSSSTSPDAKETLKILMNLINDPVVIVDNKGRFLEVSDRVGELTGSKKNELIGKTFLEVDFITSKTKAILIKNLAERIFGKKIDTYEIEVISKNGEIIPLQVKGMRIEYDGRPADMAVFHDMSKVKKAEEALRASEEKYRFIAENIPDVIWTSDENGNTSYISPSIEKVCGYTQDEIYAHGSELWFGRIHPDDIESVKVAYNSFLSKCNNFDIEYRIQRKDGQWIWIHDRATKTMNKNGKTYAEGIFSDITGRKMAEEALSNSAEEFRLTFENANDALFWVNYETGVIDRCNKAAERLLEKNREEIIGQHYTTLHPLEKKEYYANKFKEYVGQKGNENDKFEVVTKTGKVIPVSITASVAIVHGKPIIQGVFHDISKRDLAEKKLKQKIDELEKFQKVTVNREIAMIELKKEINELCKKYGEEPRYIIEQKNKDEI